MLTLLATRALDSILELSMESVSINLKSSREEKLVNVSSTSLIKEVFEFVFMLIIF